VTHPADEIMNAAQKLRHQAGIVPPHIADPLAKVLESFSATEFDREATVQETDGRHRRMLRLARAINDARPAAVQLNVRPKPDDDAYARGFAAGRRTR
jgi:hypothetical protein